MEFTTPPVAQAKSLARRLLGSRPVYPFLQRVAWRGDPVTILTYHTLGADAEAFDAWTVVRKSDFLAQMQHVRRDYDIVSLDDVLNESMPGMVGRRPRAVVTFDDGHTGLHEILLPIVERERLPVTIYVATGHIETGCPYWFDRVMNALQSTAPHTVDLRPLGGEPIQVGTAGGARNWAAISNVLEALKTQAPQRREEIARAIVDVTEGISKPHFAPLMPMSQDQLIDVSRSRWVTIGAHTHDHALLDKVPLEHAVHSIQKCVELLTEWTGRAVDHFAYPNGNYSQSLAKQVAAMGFRSAVTTREGLWTEGQSLYELPRVSVGRFDDMAKFKLNLLGA